MSAVPQSLIQREAWPSPARAWFTVGVLTAAYTLSFIDRQILNLLVVPVKQDLQLSDLQVSLLQGFAFAVFYTLVGIPLGRIADTANRRMLIIVGVLTWCVMTASCGLANGFWGLFAARVGVAIGEAALSPAALSIIADSFPKERLSGPCSVYMLGTVIGGGLALLLGGALLQGFSVTQSLDLSFLGTWRPWQLTFVAVATPGILIAALLLAVREPPRRGEQSARATSGRVAPEQGPLEYFAKHWRVYANLYLGYALMAVVIYAVLAWGPTFYVRRFDMSLAQVGLRLGTLYTAASLIGMLGGGAFTAWLQSRGHADAPLHSIALGALVMLPSAWLAFHAADAAASMAFVAVFYVAASFPSGAVAAAVQLITPARMRGVATGTFLFVVNIIGLGAGPTIAAAVSTYLLGDEQRIGQSLAWVACAVLPVAVVLLWLNRRPFRERSLA